MKYISRILTLTIKLALLYFGFTYGIDYYNPNSNFFSQHILVYLLIYLPVLIGYERVIVVILEPIIKKQKDLSYEAYQDEINKSSDRLK